MLRGRTMKKASTMIIRYSGLSLAILFAFPGSRVSAQTKLDSASATQAGALPARITQAIDETQLMTLKGNVHPLARPEFDKGAVPSSQPMKRMLLLLQRSPEQQAALQQLMLEQQSKDSPNFQKWLVPQQFGVQFGPADADIQTVTDWLARQGFQVVRVANGRTAIEFSGNAAQVQSAFHTEIHKFVVNGETRSANVSDPQIPAALAPVVKGIVSLHNFPRRTFRHDAGIHNVTRDEHGVPQFTSTTGCGPNGTSQCFFVGPADFAKIYNIPSSLDGTGVTIGIVGDSNIDPNDAISFRNVFGLTPATAPTIIVDGPDPGISGPTGDEGEGDLDVQISGMVAPKATIDFVVAEGTLTAQGTDIAAFHIIDYNLTDVMSESFGSCEPGLGSTGVKFYDALWEQAAAQGITVMVSAGDNGSAACENFIIQSVAMNGLAVSGIASTPFNVAVGGTDFDDVGVQSNFWNTTNVAGTLESAKGYIPETTWNDSCAATATSANLATVCAGALATNIVAGSGGPSAFNNTKPPWQSGLTPADGSRDVPDVSLFASDGPQSFSFYPFCEADGVPTGGTPSCAASGPFRIGGAGGTSASSPAFAGIMALIVQKMGGHRQGNANFVLYKIAATAGQSCNSTGQALSGSTCAFNDVTKGNNSVPCAGASANCSSTTTGNGVLVDPAHTTTPAWTTTTGYDYATGLGSVNVANLATQWPIAVGNFKATTSSLTLNGGTAKVTITHGASVTASATVAVVSPATGTPTGDVSLLGPQGAINSGINFNTLTGTTPDTANLTTTSLPGGSYNVTAHYAGDGTFAPSDSNAIAVTVNPENSRLQMSVVMLDPNNGNILNTNATSYPYGSFTFLHFDILNSSANPCQSLVNGGTTTGCAFDAQGAVTVTDNGKALNGGTFKINSEGSAEDQMLQLTAGMHTLSATYSGDVNYNPVTTPITDVITVSPAATATALVADRTTATTAQTVTLTATITTQSIGVGPSGTITFSTCGTPPCTAVLVPTSSNPITGTFSSATASLPTIFTTPGTKTITATYAGDANYTGSGPSTAVTVTVTQTQVGSFTVSYSPQPLVLNSATGAAVPLTVTVTPAGGFTGTVAVTPTAATLPPGVSCTPSPLNINIVSATPVAPQLMCMVTATSTTLTASDAREDRMFDAKAIPPMTPGKGWWTLSAGTGFAALFLLFLPGGRKKYRVALGLGLICILSLTMGCGGGGSAPPPPQPTPTTTQMTVSADRVPSGTVFTFNVTVTGGTPTGMVQLFEGGLAFSTVGATANVSNGKATITSPPTLQVGTHSLSVHYLGDATTASSQSGSLNLTATGSTTVAITTIPVGTPAAPAINVTIQ
jgi:subtilase family serine protease